MQRRVSVLMAFLFLTGCFSPTKSTDSVSSSTSSETLRTPQANEDHGHDDQKFETTFTNIMSEPTDEARTKRMTTFLERQIGYYNMAQNMVHEFDAELDRLYEQKKKNPNVELNLENLARHQFHLNAGRELFERNLHEVQYMYTRMLEESNKPASPFKMASSTTLEKMDRFFSENWIQEKRAVHALAQDLQEINRELQIKQPQLKYPNFQKFLKLDMKSKYIFQPQPGNLIRQNRFNSLVEKQWKLHLDQQQFKFEKPEPRTPQASVMAPDASSSAGNVNGSKFAPGLWALTYDDGPHAKHTESILNIISEAGYKAHFFWLSRNMKAYPDVVKKAADQYGFRRASHSYTHANLPTLSDTKLKYEIDDAAVAFESIVGSRPTFFRCPYGACGPSGGRIRQRIANNNMIHVMWNVDSLDWQDKNAQSIFQRVKKQMEINGRGVVLFHDIHPQTVEATKLVVAYIRGKQGWKVATMDEIVKMESGNDYFSP